MFNYLKKTRKLQPFKDAWLLAFLVFLVFYILYFSYVQHIRFFVKLEIFHVIRGQLDMELPPSPNQYFYRFNNKIFEQVSNLSGSVLLALSYLSTWYYTGITSFIVTFIRFMLSKYILRLGWGGASGVAKYASSNHLMISASVPLHLVGHCLRKDEKMKERERETN